MLNAPMTLLQYFHGKRGRYQMVADALNVSYTRLWNWANDPGRKVPAEYVRPLSEKTGVPMSVIRPDLYPRKPIKRSEAAE